MQEAFTISSESRFYTLMIPTERMSARAFTLEIEISPISVEIHDQFNGYNHDLCI